MTGFRGPDEVLEAEIEALEGIARVRVKRAAREIAELDRDLRFLRAERARRRARAGLGLAGTMGAGELAEGRAA